MLKMVKEGMDTIEWFCCLVAVIGGLLTLLAIAVIVRNIVG